MLDRQYSSYCFLASELSIEKKHILDRQQIASQWGLRLIFRMHNSDPTPQGVDNRNVNVECKFDIPNTHINDPSWLSSGTSIKCDGVKLVYNRFF